MADRENVKIATRKRFDSNRSNPKNSSNPDIMRVLLTSLSQPQMALVLSKLQLTVLPSFSTDDCLKLIRCSKVFMGYFELYSNDDIFALFDKSGDFVDFITRDGKINGIFADSSDGIKMYPCCICGDEITKADDKDDKKFGCECSACGEFFHNSCCKKPMSRELNDLMSSSPNFVKILCPKCNTSHGNLVARLEAIEKRCKVLERKLDNLKPTTYSGAVGTQNTKFIGTNTIVNLPKNVVRGLADLSRASKQEEEAERLKRTRVVI